MKNKTKLPYRTKSGLEMGGMIAEDCPSHSGPEWLKIMQEKSAALKRKLDWIEIKQDPMINHCEVYDSLGVYDLYAGKLYPQGQATQSNQETPPKQPTTKRKAYSRQRARSINETPVEAAEDSPKDTQIVQAYLERIKTPKGRTWGRRGIIVIAMLNNQGAEEDIRFSDLEFIPQEGRQQLCLAELKLCFMGVSTVCYVSDAKIYPDKVSLELQYNPSQEKIGDLASQVIFRMQPGRKMTLVFSLVLPPDNELRDYVSCDCSDRGIVIKEPNRFKSYQ